ncbi:hypothetical protein [Mycobacterium uberis]|nr:hypothetical protein [Mycobacterium uberis]
MTRNIEYTGSKLLSWSWNTDYTRRQNANSIIPVEYANTMVVVED